ncbi:hypothetical protein BK120_00280 [Paenibacillus sp. FSL A5-0031]|uniref:poly(ethylene terephthalate) hydrolase family protein n=1 Tax=Paenibacillus sp. FSL A5-0031 TaxID=1920420 RepID=UPI00096F5EC9|nr:hypothetical protein [Paenibacillus sp. FSL A5-0031]OME87807.1 hypothetical protein BK120_00280 [Paenibacillus sp. FSL A5-0031]
MITSQKPASRPWVKWILIPVYLLMIYPLKLRRWLYRYQPEPVEQRYGEPGLHRSRSVVIKAEDGNPQYKIYCPEEMDEACPVIVWGNGSDAQPENYDALLLHLATWGFVVIDSYCRHTGTGREVADTVRYTLQENANPASPFYRKLLIDRIGAVGHSQGATGVLNAGNYLDEPLQTVVTIALPAQMWCEPKDIYEIETQTAALFFMAGTHDFMISPKSSNRSAYAAVRSGQAAVMAMTRAAHHLESMGQGGMHRGYLTAWLRYRLADDSDAAAAFSGEHPELYRNKGWSGVHSQGLKAVNYERRGELACKG